ncbi:transcriptional regulator [Wenxinia marina]|nr:transcriptional regulator [Wenxinia marina]
MNVLSRKLLLAGPLPEEDLAVVEGLVANPRTVQARTDIIDRGDPTSNVHLVLEGIACRYKLLPDGRRSIMALLLPGDFCDLNVAILGHMDHAIGTLTACTIVDIPREAIDEIVEKHPPLTRALWWCTLVDEAVLREWLVNMGRRRADRQLAHFLCEIHLRLEAVGRRDGFHLSLTQEMIADLLGITTVHAQRIMAGLRQDGLIAIEDRKITVPDIEALRDFAEFEDDYLHLNGSAG